MDNKEYHHSFGMIQSDAGALTVPKDDTMMDNQQMLNIEAGRGADLEDNIPTVLLMPKEEECGYEGEGELDPKPERDASFEEADVTLEGLDVDMSIYSRSEMEISLIANDGDRDRWLTNTNTNGDRDRTIFSDMDMSIYSITHDFGELEKHELHLENPLELPEDGEFLTQNVEKLE